MNASGQEIRNPGLWALTFRTATSGFDPNTLFFNAGVTPLGGDIFDNGLFGMITLASVPEPPFGGPPRFGDDPPGRNLSLEIASAILKI